MFNTTANPVYISAHILLTGALYILYPGLYVVGAVMFVPAMFLLKRDQAKLKEAEYVKMQVSQTSLADAEKNS